MRNWKNREFVVPAIVIIASAASWIFSGTLGKPLPIILQIVIAAYLIEYTLETTRLRKASEIANENSVMPILRMGKAWHLIGNGINKTESNSIINGGNGPALNIRYVNWVRGGGDVKRTCLHKPHIIPIIPKGESYSLKDNTSITEFEDDFGLVNDGRLIRRRILDAAKRTDYIVEIILYYDVAGHLYESLSWGPESTVTETQFTKLK